jgi:hypothetical protein
MVEKLTTSLQESVLTLLATNDKHGRIASGLVKPEHFDDDYRDIATRVLAYHSKHRKAPGRAHLDDLLDDVLSNPKHKRRRQYLTVLEGIFAQGDSINAEYILSRVNEFARLQTLKAAWFESADVLQDGKEGSVAEVESIWFNALKSRDTDIDAGVFLSDKEKALSFLDKTKNNYLTGITLLDRVGMGPTPGQMLLMMAAQHAGKSWWAIHCGTQCLMQKARVVHITLGDMPEAQVVQRYYQNLLALPKRLEKYQTSEFILRDRRLDKIERTDHVPEIALSSRNIRNYLTTQIDKWGSRFDRLVVKEFPANSLSIARLDAYLDSLELVHNFIPNVLIIDYPDLLHLSATQDIRVAIGRNFVELHGLLKRRNLAGVFPTQGNRSSWDAGTVKASMVSEDASKFMTTDMALIYSQTKTERAWGLARLYVEKNRNDEGRFTLLISQNYKAGQFVLDSTLMTNDDYLQMIGTTPDDDEG